MPDRRRAVPAADPDVAGLADRVLALGRAAGLDAVGIARAEPFARSRAELERRKALGLHAGMSFTYKSPERSADPTTTLPGAAALVVGARAYRHADVPMPEGAPQGRVARYAWGDRYEPLRGALRLLAAELKTAGWRARVLVDDNALVDRESAYRAGLGWYGKNSLLLLPGRGSWFVLGSVVTDAPLPPSAAEPVRDGCGACDRCLPACPTGALVAPGVLDARRCLAWLVQAPGIFPVEHRVALGDRVYGCDDCQEACPPNRTADRHASLPPPEPGDQPWVDLLALLAMTDDELLATYGRWYLPGRDPAVLRRNALLALANVGDGRDPRVAAALAGALGHASPLVRAHAVWAAGRLGRHDLRLAARPGDTDPDVLAEHARWDG